ncbi:uncharacterized protein HMPREF1541_05139 [Cyphellophora europaea CBS 101466]|uniref:Uncharacterized protein n=1 Tax=Cyphellophora europaea (strain CBS 101466) TaxID=1220924 RepID=W2RYV7_CYPE1|nr:uncharacterized protein HMPREF1541_05139 [Cyphellophora europaea CBS 101466]ETN40859.1 hypothetical protein HMPREF1541_05139 [Cyphellophora europaea CBS 101466]
MAANGYHTPLQDLARGFIAEVKGLTVAQLKDLLRRQGLTVSGVKSELQIRAIANIEKAQHAGDRSALELVRRQLRGDNTAHSNFSSPYSSHTPASSASPSFNPSAPHLLHTSSYGMAPGRNPYQPTAGGVRFENSPFYTILRSLTSVVELKVRETTRDAARATVILPQDVAEQLQRDNKARVMVFCTADNTGYKASDITFPHQVELKCNGEEVKANLRGLKNKPGSTRPADITQFIRKKQPAFRNEVEMVYALTNKGKPSAQKFYMIVNFVVKKPVEDLVREIRHGKALSKESVLREMRREAADPDIEVSSRVMSLKCPLSYTRLQTPCRGTGCSHNQCFDATSYLQLQEQAPTWTCPQCNRPVPWSQLVLDQYVLDILNNTSKDTEQVTVEPDGKWSLGQTDNTTPAASNKKRKLNATPDSDDDDDLVVIDDSRPFTNGSTITQTLTPSSVRTPPLNGREDSVATSQRSASKRPRQEVIDLTLSDDEDDQDARPPVKRTSTTTNPYTASSIGSSSLAAFRSRPPDAAPLQPPSNRYSFQLPPISSPHSFNFNSSTSSPNYGYGGGGSNY